MKNTTIKKISLTAIFAVMLVLFGAVLTFGTSPTMAHAAQVNYASAVVVGTGANTEFQIQHDDQFEGEWQWGMFRIYAVVSGGDSSIIPFELVRDGTNRSSVCSLKDYEGVTWFYGVRFADLFFAINPSVETIVHTSYHVQIYSQRSYDGDNYDGGVLLLDTIVSVESTVIQLPPDPTPPNGYFFDGWCLDEALTVKYEGQPITSDMTFHAKFVLITYTIRYNTNGGNPLSDKLYTVESDMFTLSTPIRTGYTFIGWYATATLTGQPITQVPKGSTGHMTLYAKWDITKYKVTFYTGTTVYQEIWVNHGTSLAKYTFLDVKGETVALYSNFNMTTEYYDKTNGVTKPLALYTDRVTADIFVKVTLMTDGESKTISIPHNTTLAELESPVKEGYTFGGWFYDTAYTKPLNQSEKLTTDITLYAKFEKEIPPTILEMIGNFFADYWGWFVAVLVLGVLALIIYLIVKKIRG